MPYKFYIVLTAVHPKLPMRNKKVTLAYYAEALGFSVYGSLDHEAYLMLEKENVQLHFFLFKALDPKENYGQVYIRTTDITALYESLVKRNVSIHPNGKLEAKPWGQLEFSLLDPDTNLITFGQPIA